MNRVVLAATFGLAFGAANAADMPVYRKAPAATPDYWTGFYAGLNVGYGVIANNYADVVGVPPLGNAGRDSGTGIVGGGQFGFNWRLSPQWIAGFEADFQGSNQRVSDFGLGTPVLTGFNSSDACLNWFGTVRGRLGWNAMPSSLLYATGGFAYGQTQMDTTISIPGPNVFTSATSREVATGYAAGGGIETQFAPNWSVKVEYLYLNLGTHSVATTASAQAANMTFADNIVRLGVNYKMGGDGSFPNNPMYSNASLSAPTWTGVYVGLNAGYGILSGSAFNSEGIPAPEGDMNKTGADGFIGGGQIGYNWQVASSWVVGVEADFQSASQRGASLNRGLTGGATFANLEERLNWFGTVRGRAGWLAMPSTLLYATGGFAYGQTVINDFSFLGPILSTNSQSKGIGTGYAAGGGAETQLGGNWSAKAEYLYVDLGSRGTFAVNGGLNRSTSVAFHENVYRLGVNYRF